MLTSLEVQPDAATVEFPPLVDQAPFEAAIRARHGRYVFSSDNEVLFFADKEMSDG